MLVCLTFGRCVAAHVYTFHLIRFSTFTIHLQTRLSHERKFVVVVARAHALKIGSKKMKANKRNY